MPPKCQRLVISWQGRYVKARGLGLFAFLSQFPAPLFYCPPSQQTQKLWSPSQPQWGKPDVRVGGWLLATQGLGSWRASLCLIYIVPRPLLFLPLPSFLRSFLPHFSWREAAPEGPNIYVDGNFRAINLTV